MIATGPRPSRRRTERQLDRDEGQSGVLRGTSVTFMKSFTWVITVTAQRRLWTGGHITSKVCGTTPIMAFRWRVQALMSKRYRKAVDQPTTARDHRC